MAQSGRDLVATGLPCTTRPRRLRRMREFTCLGGQTIPPARAGQTACPTTIGCGYAALWGRPSACGGLSDRQGAGGGRRAGVPSGSRPRAQCHLFFPLLGILRKSRGGSPGCAAVVQGQGLWPGRGPGRGPGVLLKTSAGVRLRETQVALPFRLRPGNRRHSPVTGGVRRFARTLKIGGYLPGDPGPPLSPDIRR